jgi:hypothetical protein
MGVFHMQHKLYEKKGLYVIYLLDNKYRAIIQLGEYKVYGQEMDSLKQIFHFIKYYLGKDFTVDDQLLISNLDAKYFIDNWNLGYALVT